MSYHIRVNGLPLCEAVEDGLDCPEHIRCMTSFKRSANKYKTELETLHPEKTISVQRGDCPTLSGGYAAGGYS